MKMMKKIALVSAFAVLTTGFVFAAGKKDAAPAPAPVKEAPAAPVEEAPAEAAAEAAAEEAPAEAAAEGEAAAE